MAKIKSDSGFIKNVDSRKLFLAVALILVGAWFSVFVFFPLGYTIVGSFFNWNPNLGIWNFIGFDNFTRAFANKLVMKSFVNTFYFATGVTILRIIIALVIAVLISSLPRFKNFFRTVYFLPVICSLFAISFVWRWMYNPSSGVFNQILHLFGLPGLRWLLDKRLSMPSIMFLTVWKDMGYAMILFLAGLAGIPQTYVEAAKIDGASNFKVFRHITLPLLKPTMVFVVVVSLISYLQTFVQIWVMRPNEYGGPTDQTITVAYSIYNWAFKNFEFGFGSAISVLLFIITLILSLIQLRLMRINWRY